MKSIKLITFLIVIANFSFAADWSHWRGPSQNGYSTESGLISEWSRDGKNLIWQKSFVGRSTPIVMNDRVYVQGRTGKDLTEQEHIACFDAISGDKLWEHKFNVFHTTIPFNRVGWASPAGDLETGNVYVHGVQGMFYCFDPDGEIVWSRSLTEEFGRISGYGGRTHTPFVDGDLVIISYLNTSWGDQAPGRHRYFAFNKRNGDVVWISTPGGPPKDTTYSVPTIAEIRGKRLLIAGNADGSIYAIDIRNGKKIWGFRLSRRGMNASIVADGNLIYAAHSEENLDNTSMGRVVCIDGSGSGEITETHEVWRADGLQVGYTSPALHDGEIYVVDNSANLHCLNAKNGDQKWVQNIGTVGKGSPIWADGKIYVTEVNGNFHILKIGSSGAEIVNTVNLTVEKEDRYAEIYGSPAISNGRIFFATEDIIYCLGEDREISPMIQIVPAEIVLKSGEKRNFDLQIFDAGREIKFDEIEWSIKELDGKIVKNELTIDKNAKSHAGTVIAKFGETQGVARVRVISDLPWIENFESVAVGKIPTHWIGAVGKFFVRDQNGNKILAKSPVKRGLNRSIAFIGTPDMKNYTIEIDAMGTRNKRRLPDMGLVANRYILDLQGIHQKLQIRSWSSDLRMAKTIDFKWEIDVWYSIKMSVEIENGEAIIRGKVWKRGEIEPKNWTIEAIDPLPNEIGNPGIYGYSAAEIFYDNLKVTTTE